MQKVAASGVRAEAELSLRNRNEVIDPTTETLRALRRWLDGVELSAPVRPAYVGGWDGRLMPIAHRPVAAQLLPVRAMPRLQPAV